MRTAALGTPALSIHGMAVGSTGPETPPTQRRVVFAEGEVNAAVVHRSCLAVGDTLTGPVVVEEDEATTILGPGDTAVVLATGAVEVTW